MNARREILSVVVSLCWLAPLGRADDRQAALTVRIEEAAKAGVGFVLKQQSADGAWRSDMYPPFKSGEALTAHVASALANVPQENVSQAKLDLAAQFLAKTASRQSLESDEGLAYPAYTAAGAVKLAKQQAVCDVWIRFLRARQLTEDRGWRPDDPQYGGWGYAKDLPQKPPDREPISPLVEPNLSATVFSLDALHAAGTKDDDAAIQKASRFVERMQNWSDDAAQRDKEYDDGGFFFIRDDAVRNKAGVIGKDARGRERFASYGSMTADGYRALRLCGRKADVPRVVAAEQWLFKNFAADKPPGKYTEQREPERNGVYYYYARSIANSLQMIAADRPEQRARVRECAAQLADKLIALQHPDGSWTNPIVAQREDDPLVATPFAVEALHRCREILQGKN